MEFPRLRVKLGKSPGRPRFFLIRPEWDFDTAVSKMNELFGVKGRTPYDKYGTCYTTLEEFRNDDFVYLLEEGEEEPMLSPVQSLSVQDIIASLSKLSMKSEERESPAFSWFDEKGRKLGEGNDAEQAFEMWKKKYSVRVSEDALQSIDHPYFFVIHDTTKEVKYATTARDEAVWFSKQMWAQNPREAEQLKLQHYKEPVHVRFLSKDFCRTSPRIEITIAGALKEYGPYDPDPEPGDNEVTRPAIVDTGAMVSH